MEKTKNKPGYLRGLMYAGLILSVLSGCSGKNNWLNSLLGPNFDMSISASYDNEWGYENRTEAIKINAKNTIGLQEIVIQSLNPGNTVIAKGTYPVTGTNATEALDITYGSPGTYKVNAEVKDSGGNIERRQFNRIVGQGETNGDASLQAYLLSVVNPLATNYNEIKNLGFFNTNPLLTAEFDATGTRGTGEIFRIHYINTPADEDYSKHIDDAAVLNSTLLIIRPGEDIATKITQFLNQ